MRIQIDQLNLAYSAQGDGTPVLFIHGYPLNRSMWERQMESMSDIAYSIAPDLRGFGETPLSGIASGETGALVMELLADDCARLLDALEIKRPVVIAGLSMGGYIALAFYRKYRARLAGLVLMATRAGADSPEGRQKRDEAAELAHTQGAGAIASAMLPKMLAPVTYETQPELVRRVETMMAGTSVPGIVGALQGMRDRPDSNALLAEIEHPTLILHGADDQLISLGEAQSMQAAIPGAELEVVPASGHLLNLEQPGLVNHHLRNFVTRLAPGSS